MKKIILFFFFTLSMFSQKTTELFKSAKLGTSRPIIISLPASYEKEPTKRYPLLILLDGEYLFDPFNGALTYGAYWDDLPETIIVGITQNKNNDRESDSSYDQSEGVPTNKGAAFFEFLGGELIPYIESKYRTAPFRIIAGHDTTAGFLNFFLYKDYPLFNAYISLSPELAPKMEQRISINLAKLKQPLFYYQSSGSGDIKQLREPIQELDENIKKIQNPLLNYKFDDFANASHYSLVLYSIPSALYQIFESYKPISSAEFAEKIVVLQEGYVDYLVKKYDLIDKTLGMKIPVRLNDFKAIEAAILKNNAYNELDQLSQIADKNYPKSMLASYQLGLMYEKKGDAKRAAQKYQRASQLEEIGDLTKDMMFEKYDDMKSLTQKK
ncbi:alpha/beta hydrolase [Flavobacterium muglaense]|uniref:Alpha/beta hydrolase n=1 Tax=Flavobacterium muglaense TaxID=2764716 RepID=A0A923MYN5_9FLAO|nr:alpha/beta hydrolase-fold protein [Flavobacterium muglaense]MBC5837424.1 alpha/beta hydrolase [Flavobacterium muglaense]MBC5843952.1 alpha/beta hydrolase [Flavobacterium muglaense]